MNKDVIYIEPEDDITDIINKIESSKEKIVALVLPKKTSVLRSIVNVRLIAKTSKKADKTTVFVTTDPTIMKLSATAKMPVTKDLQSAPTIPTIDDLNADDMTAVEDLVERTEEDGGETVVAEEENKAEVKEATEEETKDEEGKEETEEANKEESEKESEKVKRSRKGKFANNPVFSWFTDHKKIAIIGGVGLMLFILLMIWAFGIAPSAIVTVGIRTTAANFSENVTFTEVLDEENASEGKFYLQQKKLEDKVEVEFEATGQKNIGEKAKGKIIVYVYFAAIGNVPVPAGTEFRIDNLAYVADEGLTLAWDGIQSSCENGANDPVIVDGGISCLKSGIVSVTAMNPGEKYNIEASSSGWTSTARVWSYTREAMSGGTDEIITIVQQSDIDAALAKLETSDEETNKEKLFDEISDTSFIIEPSFKQTAGEAVSTPKVGEEVKDNKKAKLSVVTTISVYYVDKTKVEEFIKEKAELAENYKIYSINDPFVENFVKTDGGYIGKLKTSYVYGPKVTENDIVEIVKGKGLGTAQHDLKDIDGISSIKIDPSYPWVMSIPNDPNKITVILSVEGEE